MNKLAVVDEYGKVGVAPEAEAKAGYASGRFKVPSDEQWKKYEAERDYGGVAGGAAAVIGGAADAMSFNMATPAMVGLAKLIGGEEEAKSMKRTIEGVNLAHNVARPVGEVLGFVGPGAIGGISKAFGLTKAAQLAESANMGMRGYQAIGGAAEGLGKAVLGESTLATVASKALGMGAETATMGATSELGRQLTEEMIGSPSLNAEKILAEAGHNFMLGAALGGAGSALGFGVKKGSQAVKDLLLAGEPMEERLAQVADDVFGNALGGSKPQLSKTEKYYRGGKEEFFRDAKEELKRIDKEMGGKGEVSGFTQSRVGELSETGLTQSENKLSDFIKKSSNLAKEHGISVDFDEVVARLRKDLLEPLQGNASEAVSEAAAEKYIQRLQSIYEANRAGLAKELGVEVSAIGPGKVDIDFLRKARLDADGAWKKNKTLPEGSIHREIRNKLEQITEEHLDNLSTYADAPMRAEYQAVKKNYQTWRTLSDIAEENSLRGSANNLMSLTGKIGTSAGAMIGSTIGGLPGAGIGALLGAVGSKIARNKLPFMMAGAAEKLSGAAKAARAAKDATRTINESVDSLVLGTPAKRGPSLIPPAIEMFGKTRRQRNESVAKIVDHFSDPSINLANAQQKVAHLERDTPAHAGALATKQVQVANYLAANAPKPIPSVSLIPWVDVKMYSDDDIALYAKKLRAAVDPLSVLKDAKDGFVSPEAVATVKDLFPEMYEKMVARAASHMLPSQPGKRGKKKGPQASLSQSVQLSILFDINYPLTDPMYLQQIHPAQQASPDGPQRQDNTPPTRNSGSVAGEMAKSADSPTEKLGDEL